MSSFQKRVVAFVLFTLLSTVTVYVAVPFFREPIRGLPAAILGSREGLLMVAFLIGFVAIGVAVERAFE